MSLSCEMRGIVLAVCMLTGVLGAVSGAAAQVADAGAPTAAPPNGGAAVLGEPTPPPAPADPNAPPGGYAPAPPPQAPGAYGQQPPQGYGQPGYGQPGYVEPVQEAPPPPEHARTDDANADHIVLGSTAFTAPKGSVYFSDYELFVIQAGVAVTDNVQLTATTWLPIVPEQPFFLDVSAKFAFLQTSRFHMAGIASILGITGTGSGDALPVVGRLALVATACITENCYVSASASAMFLFTENTTDVVPVILNFGMTARVAGIFSLLAEVNGIAAVGDLGRSSIDVFDAGVLLGYGVRFSNQNFGFDLTFVKPIIRGTDDFTVLGVPWLAFTYRTDALF